MAAKNLEFPQPALLTVKQSMHALGGISRGTLYQLVRDGRLRTLRIGTRRFATPEAIRQCVEQLHTPTAEWPRR